MDSQISICTITEALDLVEERLSASDGGYVCFSNAHTIVIGRQDLAFRRITNHSFLSLADGKPIYWVGRGKGHKVGHVPGPDFLMHALQRFRTRRHFFYGSTEEALGKLTQSLREQIPGLRICGTLSPPFRPLNSDDKTRHYAEIRDSGAELVWVGLGAPKQEQWMYEAWQSLAPGVLFGVGAAFDFHAGTVRRAPLFMQKAGLEWAYRLSREPRRLWRRYLTTNSLFIWYLATDALRARLSQHES